MNLVTILYLPVMLLAPIWKINSITCKAYQWIFGFIIRFQAWIVTIGSFDRLLSTFKPHNCLFKDKRRFQIATLVVIAIIIFILIFYALYYPVPVEISNITTCSFPNDQNARWVWMYYNLEYAIIRVSLPFTVMIISSIMISYKMYKTKRILLQNVESQRERDLFISLISYDIFFVIFRIPMVVYSFLNKDPISFFVSFNYSIFLAVGLNSNVFVFVVFIFFNKVYRKLFFRKMKCQPQVQDNQINLRNVLSKKIELRVIGNETIGNEK